MQTITVIIERHPGRNMVRVQRDQAVVFSADHVQEETLAAVVRVVVEHWLDETSEEIEGEA